MAVRPYKRKGQIVPRSWIIDYYPQGRNGKRVMQIMHDCTEAEAREVEAQIRRQHRPISGGRIVHKLVEIVADFSAYYKTESAPATVRDFWNCWKRLAPHFGDLLLNSITEAHINHYKTTRLADGVSKRTINKELSYLSRMLTWAIDQRYIEPLPFKIRKFPAKSTKAKAPHVPTPQEMQALLDALEPEYLGIALLMYDAGLRRAEALQIRAEDVQLKRKIIYITGKGSKERVLPITTRRLLKELTAAKQRTKRGYLYTNPKTKKPWYSIRKALARAADKAGIEGRVYHHLLRHSFGTHAIAAGINLRSIQGMMGHSTSQITETYTHLAADLLTSEGEKFSAMVEKPDTTPAEENDDKQPE
jgi:integrase/recombinase XerD